MGVTVLGIQHISIHALLAESDAAKNGSTRSKRNFYPRSPCGERRMLISLCCGCCVFLSTLSLRRATSARPEIRRLCVISIHALLAESDSSNINSSLIIAYFYPRSPCGERRRVEPFHATARLYFYPRSPCGERLGRIMNVLSGLRISIHALLAESDCLESFYATARLYFYPRSPCGERQQSASYNAYLEDFYPRSPCGERPCICVL